MKKLIKLAIFTLLFIFLAVPALAKSDNAAYRGEAPDTNYSQLGIIKYLSNKSGYHFWFTMSADLGPYIAEHSYHNIYKVNLGDTDGWCGPIFVGSAGRTPYSLVGHQDEMAYYKMWDMTDEAWVPCP